MRVCYAFQYLILGYLAAALGVSEVLDSVNGTAGIGKPAGVAIGMLDIFMPLDVGIPGIFIPLGINPIKLKPFDFCFGCTVFELSELS